jgi:hypothetical protein
MMHAVVAVIAGYAIWTVLWLGGNALFFGEAAAVVGAGEAYTSVGPLLGVIALSIVCSLAAGMAAGRLAGARAPGAVLVMAGLLLLTGIGVQAGVWNLMPTWYHVVFLALVVPGAVLGGKLVAGRGMTARPA